MRNVIAAALLLLAIPGLGEEDKTSLRLPWSDIQKILGLNQDDVSLSAEEFQTLLRNTGAAAPAHTSAGGRVILKRAEFQKLIQALVPPPPEPPMAYVTKASYKGRLAGDSLRFEARLLVNVRKKSGGPVRVNLFPGQVALQEALLDGKPALVEQEQGRFFLTLDKAGDHTVSLSFSVPAPGAEGLQRASFPVARTPITELRLEIPHKHLDISIQPSLHAEVRPTPNGTEVEAVLPPTGQVSVAWNPVAPETEKGPAKLYAETGHLLSIEDDAVRVQSRIHLQALQNTVNKVLLEVPEGFTVIAVQGDALGEWRETREGGKTRLTVPFTHARKGEFDLSVTCEQVLAAEKTTSTFTGLPVSGAVRDRGFLGVELKTNAEVTAPDFEGLERVDIRELPAPILAMTERPLLYGYKYLRPPFRLALGVGRHEGVEAISFLIEKAEGRTFFLEDGKRVHSVTYSVRNAWKQFLEVPLPAGNRLWSTFVDGQPVKPSAGPEGRVLIPLGRSHRGRGDTSSFPVELIYFEQQPPMGPLGKVSFRFPVPDVTVSRLTWSLHAPLDRRYAYLGRALEKLGEPEPVPLTRAMRVNENAYQLESIGAVARKKVASSSAFGGMHHESLLMSAAAPAVQEDGEGDSLSDRGDAREPAPQIGGQGLRGMTLPRPASQVAGVLPIRVQVPVKGRVSRFGKTLPSPEEPVELSLYYVSEGLLAAGRWLLVLFVLGLIYRSRRKWEALLRRAAPLLDPILSRARRVTPFWATAGAAVLCLAGALAGAGTLIFCLIIFMAAAARWLLVLAQGRQGDLS